MTNPPNINFHEFLHLDDSEVSSSSSSSTTTQRPALPPPGSPTSPPASTGEPPTPSSFYQDFVYPGRNSPRQQGTVPPLGDPTQLTSPQGLVSPFPWQYPLPLSPQGWPFNPTSPAGVAVGPTQPNLTVSIPLGPPPQVAHFGYGDGNAIPQLPPLNFTPVDFGTTWPNPPPPGLTWDQLDPSLFQGQTPDQGWFGFDLQPTSPSGLMPLPLGRDFVPHPPPPQRPAMVSQSTQTDETSADLNQQLEQGRLALQREDSRRANDRARSQRMRANRAARAQDPPQPPPTPQRPSRPTQTPHAPTPLEQERHDREQSRQRAARNRESRAQRRDERSQGT